MYGTSNVVKFEYKSTFWCCKWYSFEAINAYLSEIVVYKSHELDIMESPGSDVGSCNYNKSVCQLSSDAMLKWKQHEFEHCKYVFFKNMTMEFRGHKTDNSGCAFLSLDKTIAITSTKKNFFGGCATISMCSKSFSW